MIYSIGYSALTPEELVKVLDALDVARLIDVRTSPRSRKAGFGSRQLPAFFGDRYLFAGDRLGGRAEIAGDALTWLVEQDSNAGPQSVAIMCLEEAPGDCHRHYSIAMPLIGRSVDITHIYQNELFYASDLQVAINGENDYPIYGHVFPEVN